jgi:hypothetical protein
MNPVSDTEARSMALEAIVTAVLRTFYHVDDSATKILFDRAMEEAARSLETIARAQPKWRNEMRQALVVVEEISERMKSPISRPFAKQ